MQQINTSDGALAESERAALVRSYVEGAVSLRPQLDRIAALAAGICHAPLSFVSFVTADRQQFVGSFGSEIDGTPRAHSFCAHAMQGDECMVVADATADPRFTDNPLVCGDPHVRFYAGQPLRTREGEPLGSLCVIDSSPRPALSQEELSALETLAQSIMALCEQERLKTEAQQREKRNHSRIVELEQQFTNLADALPQLVWSTDAVGMSDYFNEPWCNYTGQPAEESFGAGWLEFIHPDDRERAGEVWAAAVESQSVYDVEYRIRDGEGDYRWFVARGTPLFDVSGELTRWIGTCTDIDDQKSVEEELTLLSSELSHRIKNIFAVISGLISMTVRRRSEFAEPGLELQERVLALGRAHDFVRAQRSLLDTTTQGSQVQGLLTALLSPYEDRQAQRIHIHGADPKVDDRSATPLALFFHELATNAAKYGALSEPSGTVEIEITGDDPVSFTWRERGGPEVCGERRRGFGSELVAMSVERQLTGKVEYDWQPEGLGVRATIPASALWRE